LRHIREVWCNEQQNLFDYVTKWMAHLVQRPYKTGVALLVYSREQGVGKSMLAEWFAKDVIGRNNYTTVGDMNDLLSRFNGCLENKILTLIDEVGGHGSIWRDEAKLKKLITQPDYQIELKGQEKRHVDDFNNYIFTTNCETPIKIEGTDRRYCVLQCSAKYRSQGLQYFRPLSNQMNDRDCSLHFFHWLTQMPLETDDYLFNACFELPNTDLKKQMVEITMGNVDTWFVSLYKSYIESIGENGSGEKIFGEDDSTVIFDEEGNLTLAPTKLYNCYKWWYDHAKPEDKQVSLKKFGMIMKEILGATKNVRSSNQIYKVYQSDIKSIGENIKKRLGFDP